ncbi:MAG TPA: ribbon-helix-helix domain-containing protein [Candidatus Acidoferrum sp.]|nr:ribbon-helix-helix domain-containing protein [Candidatus Acidoferrum sp.]
MASQRISVRVPAKTMQRLKERSRSVGMRESDIVRQALEEHLSKNHQGRTAYDLFLEAGLIGCAHGAPKDLATSKRYFKRFGKAK